MEEEEWDVRRDHQEKNSQRSGKPGFIQLANEGDKTVKGARAFPRILSLSQARLDSAVRKSLRIVNICTFAEIADSRQDIGDIMGERADSLAREI